MSEYRVRFEVFEGPLDLLLHLIRKEEVDIYEVNLTKIATEFIDYLNLMRELDLDIAGEFVVMAATLMLIKSRELLPRDQRPEGQGGEEEEAEDPRWELIRQLVEYRKFKDAAGRLQEYEVRVENTYPRIPGRIELPEDNTPRRSDASIFDLLSAVNAVMKRFSNRGGESRDVFEDRWSVSEKIEMLLGAVRERAQVRFFDLFNDASNRSEVVCTFLAILELIRLRMIVASQPEPFSDILIQAAPPPPDPNAPPAAEGSGASAQETTDSAPVVETPSPEPQASPAASASVSEESPSPNTPEPPPSEVASADSPNPTAPKSPGEPPTDASTESRWN